MPLSTRAVMGRVMAFAKGLDREGYLILDYVMVVTRNRHGNLDYLVSNDLTADRSTMVRRKRRRCSVETIFRDSKPCAGLEACQGWVDQVMVRHVALVLLCSVVLQRLRHSPHEAVGALKQRWQLAVLQAGDRPPTSPGGAS